jgi:integrase
VDTSLFLRDVLNPILRSTCIMASIEASGLRCGNYAFRHMNVTLMDQLAIPLKTRQQRAGHSDPSITLSHYTHAVDAAGVAAADQLGAMLSPMQGVVQ